MKISLIAFCFSLIFSQVMAQTHSVNIDKMLKENQANPLGIYTSIRYHHDSSKLSHQELASAPNYVPLKRGNDVGMHNLGLELSKEFFRESYVSFNVIGRFGMGKGRNGEQDEEFSYETKGHGKHYGGGLSLNLNMSGFGLRIQPYLSGQYLKYNNQYDLLYSHKQNLYYPVNIHYESDFTVLQYSLGTRFIDDEAHLFSYLALDYYEKQTETISARGNQRETDLSLSNLSAVKYSQFTFSVGVGFFF